MENKEEHMHKFTVRLPIDYYFQLTRVKENFMRKEKKFISTNDIFKDALDLYLESKQYPKIEINSN